jgi:hypothetical protein
MRLRQINKIEEIYKTWSSFLNASRPSTCTFREFYEEQVEPALRSAGVSRAVFDGEKFPSLHGELPLAGNINRSKLPLRWNLKALNDSTSTDLERLLLAYIWKRGELWRVQHVLAGLRDNSNGSLRGSSDDVDEKSDDGPAVMWQFGKHLANPKAEPIFDQHTSRHRVIYEWLAEGHELVQLADVSRLEKLTTRMQCKNYVRWWRNTIEQKVKKSDEREKPADALLWADRIMFALGKAGNYKTSGETNELPKPNPWTEAWPVKVRQTIKSTGMSKKPNKRELAEAIFLEHRGEPRSKVIELFLKIGLTQKGASTYYQHCKKKYM